MVKKEKSMMNIQMIKDKMKQQEKTRLINWGKRYITKNGGDYQAFDFDSEIDMSLSWIECKNIIKEKINSVFKIETEIDKNKIEKDKEMEKFLNTKLLEKEEKQAELNFMKSLEKIEKDKTTNIIEEIYYVPKSFAKMVAKGNSTGFLLWGRGGLGKTYCVIRAFKEEKIKFVFCSGFSSVLEFYNFLYNHRKDNILFDDVSNLLKSPAILDLLKSALYSPKGKRIVQYQSTSPRLQVPHLFEFTGTITILVNELRKSNEDLKAVADRILNFELDMDYKTIMKVIFEIIKQPYKNLKKEERQMIGKWIQENTSSATQNMNLRLLFKIYEIFRYDKNSWEKLAGKIIINDKRLLEVKELLENNSSVKNAELEFIERGGSRAGFYRIKRRLK